MSTSAVRISKSCESRQQKCTFSQLMADGRQDEFGHGGLERQAVQDPCYYSDQRTLRNHGALQCSAKPLEYPQTLSSFLGESAKTSSHPTCNSLSRNIRLAPPRMYHAPHPRPDSLRPPHAAAAGPFVGARNCTGLRARSVEKRGAGMCTGRRRRTRNS